MFDGVELTRTPVEVVTDVHWTPDNRLSSFVFQSFVGPELISYQARVQYLYGDDDVSVRPENCEPKATGHDGSGRLRLIRVELGQWGEGVWHSEKTIYQRWYTWAAEQIIAIDACYEGQSQPLSEFRAQDESTRGFDQMRRLVRNFPDSTNAIQPGRRYLYAENGTERAAEEFENGLGWTWTASNLETVVREAPAENLVELPNNRGYRTLTLDAAGRRAARLGAKDSTVNPNSMITYGFNGVGRDGGYANVDSVLQAACVNGACFNYYFDGANRRLRKQYPNAASEDFFYDLNSRLISERSFVGEDDSKERIVDEYVYLGDVPVLALRTKFGVEVPGLDGLVFRRTPDFSNDSHDDGCRRREETNGPCGIIQVVADQQSRPVLALDNSGKVTGVGEYDAFGSRNRVRMIAESAHPISGAVETIALGIGQPKQGDLQSYFSAEVSFYDLTSAWGSSGLSAVMVQDGTTSVAQVRGSPPYMRSDMVQGDVFDVRLIPDPNGASGDGVVLEGYTYDRRSEEVYAGYFPPLRSPGQYADDESSLYENWHRTYDPASGQYLSPEPLLQSPAYVRRMAQTGLSVPTYAYAANNPLRYVDRTGLATQVIISYGSWAGFDNFGSHAAVRVDNGGAGEPVLFDPSGGYRERTRGSGGFFEGDEAALAAFIRYHTKQGDGVLVYNFDTTPEEEAEIAKRFSYGSDEGPNDPRGLECARTVSTNLSGIGPFKSLRPTQFPGNLSRQLCGLMGVCSTPPKRPPPGGLINPIVVPGW